MTTAPTSLASQQAMVEALHTARRVLISLRLRSGVEERAVRTVLYEISCDAMQPLPLDLQALMPAENSRKIVSHERFTILITTIEKSVAYLSRGQ